MCSVKLRAVLNTREESKRLLGKHINDILSPFHKARFNTRASLISKTEFAKSPIQNQENSHRLSNYLFYHSQIFPLRTCRSS